MPNSSRLSTHNRHGLVPERLPSKNLELLLSKENSTVRDRSSAAKTSNIHRESKAFHHWHLNHHVFDSSVSTIVYIRFERISSECDTKDSSWSTSIIDQFSSATTTTTTTTKSNTSIWFSLESVDGFINKTSMIMERDFLLIMYCTRDHSWLLDIFFSYILFCLFVV